MITRLLIVNLIYFCLPLLSFQVLADAKITELKVAMSDVDTLSYQEDGQYKGIHYNILTQLEKDLGLKFNYSLYPHVRLAQQLIQESPDITILMEGACDKFASDYEHYGPLYEAAPTIYLKKTFDQKNKNVRIGRLRGTCSELMAENVKPENGVNLPSMKQALEMMELNRLDGICGLDTVVKYTLKKYSHLNLKLVVFKTQPSSIQFRAVICAKKSLPQDIKNKIAFAVKKIAVEH